MGEIEKEENSVSAAVKVALVRRVASIRRSSLFVKICLIAIGSLVVAVAQLAQIPEKGALSGWQWGGIIAAFVVALGSVFAILTEHDATEQLLLASKALDEAENERAIFEAQRAGIDDLIDEHSRVVEIYQAMRVMRDALETYAADGLDEEKLCELLVKVSHRSLRISMDFRTEDQATICIYKAEHKSGRAKLRCIAQWREIECNVADARTWDEGVGIAGICYTNGREIIVPDLQTEGVNAVFGGSGSNARLYDADRYRSMAAVPVMVQKFGHKPWGVVVTTNNRADHFSAETKFGIKADEGARMLANMVALGVSMCALRDKSIGNSTQVNVSK